MESVRTVEHHESFLIRHAWVHNGELLVQTADDSEVLVCIAKFATAEEVKPKRKAGRPRTGKNGLGKEVLTDNDRSPTTPQRTGLIAAQ